MNCGDIGPLLSAYYDGEVTADEREFIENCLGASPEARAQLDDYRRITGEFQAIPQPLPPADLRRSVMGRVHQVSGTLPAARNSREATHRYTATQRTATGTVRRPLTLASVFGQGLRFGALAAALIAVGIIFVLVLGQINKNKPSEGVAFNPAEQTATAVAQLLITNPPTPPPTATLAQQATATPATIIGAGTVTPAPPDATPTDTIALVPPTEAVPPANTPVPPALTDTAAPSRPSPTAKPQPSDTPIIVAPIQPSEAPATVTGAPATNTAAPAIATSVPPSSTPTVKPSSTPPPTNTPLPIMNTPVPTAESDCNINPIRGFGKVYQENPDVAQNLGCAIDSEAAITGTLLTFQRGFMIWDSQNRHIYVFYTRGNKLEQFYENWEPEDGEPTPVVQPPGDNVYIPARGFGKVWYKHQMWNSLGFATDPYEEPIHEALQHFAKGQMFWTEKREIYVITGTPSPSPDHDAVQFSGQWLEYPDEFVDGSTATPSPNNGKQPNSTDTTPLPGEGEKQQ